MKNKNLIQFTDLGKSVSELNSKQHEGEPDPLICALIINSGGGFHENAVRSVYESLEMTRLPFSVTFIDALGEEDGVDIVHSFPNMRYIIPAEECSYARALNLGINENDAPFFIAMNSESLLRSFDVQGLIKEFDDPRIAAFTPYKYLGSDDLQANLIKAYFDDDELTFDGALPKNGAFNFGIPEGMAFFRKDLFVYLGMADEKYNYTEYSMNDFCYRAYAAGFYVVAYDGFVTGKDKYIKAGREKEEARKRFDKLYLHFKNSSRSKYKPVLLKILLEIITSIGNMAKLKSGLALLWEYFGILSFRKEFKSLRSYSDEQIIEALQTDKALTE